MAGKLKSVSVDPNLCVGSSMCIMQEPEAFEMGEDGHARFVGDTANAEAIAEAADLCPVSAITLVYED